MNLTFEDVRYWRTFLIEADKPILGFNFRELSSSITHLFRLVSLNTYVTDYLLYKL